MKAVTRRAYGSPESLGLEEVARPEVGDDEVLVEVLAASVNASDVEHLEGRPAYLRMAPRAPILGSDVAGRVRAVGGKVTRFRPGDEVLADTLYHGLGGFAEYVAVPEEAPMARKPEGLSFAVAAAIPQAAVIALQGIRDRGRVEAGQRVLINGAGGGAGSFAVQLARAAGAEVTAVDRASKLETLRRLGARHTVDYTREDFAAGGRRYDFIFDLAAHRSILDYRRALEPDGVYAMIGGSTGTLLRALVLGPLISRTGGRKMGLLAVRPNSEDLAHVAGLAAAGELEAVIDRRYPLAETAAALGRAAAGEVCGKVVITM